LTFAKVVTLIVLGHKRPQQTNLNKFYKAIGEVKQVPTASAYCQARHKLQGALFLYLNDLVRQGFYELWGREGQVRTWRGRRLVGVDGTYLNVPDTPETRQRYSLQPNQHGQRVQALGSVAYDLLNEVGLSAALDRKRAEKELLFEHHLAPTQAGDLFVLDRLYADYAVMAFLLDKQRDFVIRFPRQTFQAVQAFWQSEQFDQIVTLQVTDKQQRFVREHGLAKTIQIRLVKVVLDTGEIEVLGTSLLDQRPYPAAEFKWVYGRRWGVETYLDRIKNVFEVERFSGHSVLSIEQDFYGVLFLATLQSVLSKEAEAELEQHSQPNPCLYPQQVNQSVGYSAMLDYAIELLMNQRKGVDETLEALHQLFKTNPTLRREGRQVPRKKASPSQKLWFYRYTKRIIA
jgi:hypothetical protein